MSSNTPKDPIAEKLAQARDIREQQRAEADAAADQAELDRTYQSRADKSGRDEVSRIEERFISRCESINADKSEDDPDFRYDSTTHELRAGNYAIRLSLSEGFSPYWFDMYSGMRSDANQVFGGFIPEHDSANWRFLARMDKDGFYWECDGRRLSPDEVVEEGFGVLLTNLTR